MEPCRSLTYRFHFAVLLTNNNIQYASKVGRPNLGVWAVHCGLLIDMINEVTFSQLSRVCY